jgi:molecular chaperone Hsp33
LIKWLNPSKFHKSKEASGLDTTDRIIRAMNQEKTVRVLLANTTRLVDEARERHGTTPTATAALGRVLTAAVMMGSDLKGQESVTVRVNGGGPLGTILAAAGADCTVRGYVDEPGAEVPEKYRGKLDVGKAVGTDGYLEVVKDLGLKSPFGGTVPLASGEIAEDMVHYFTFSEQVPSLVALGVYVERDRTVGAAGGLIIQALPGADDTLLGIIEEKATSLGPITGLLRQEDALEDIMHLVMEDIPYQIIDERAAAFRCKCSQEKINSIAAALSQEDIEQACADRGLLEITCNFCNQVYQLTPAEIEEIKKASGEDSQG